jgi:PAB-dependent poly(A)-specific ribonuclease subunit 3
VPLPDAFSHNYFMSDEVREDLQKRTEALRSVVPALGLNLPEELQGYHTLVPLETTSPDRRRFGNWFSTVYKAVSEKDGVTYVLRRVESESEARQAYVTSLIASSLQTTIFCNKLG